MEGAHLPAFFFFQPSPPCFWRSRTPGSDGGDARDQSSPTWRPFRRALARAGPGERGIWSHFGIQPTRPETGYGYIQRGDTIGDDGRFKVKRFVETKADLVQAHGLWSPALYWKSGPS
ncbi:hypothetical protein D6C00_14170 [Thiohalobacter thiocyanaticus]|uniref:Uncharacterized protein n=1 Tax=Thiohalobacter thiocyanaticus TaxID=585455 RepID=A0A426QMK3_9GAMM|nr:hypothetical protein D6C00_14170 [Thiohalobacter thiocyanaticus]